MTYQLIRLSTIISILILGLIFGNKSALSEKVKIEEIPKDGFARIKFTWPSPVPFIARMVNKKLEITLL